MSYKIDFLGWGSVFAVPTDVVDKGLKLASEQQLKVLLYILRNSGNSLTDDTVSQALSIHPEDVKDSIEYWIGKGLLASFDDLVTLPKSNSESKEEIVLASEDASDRIDTSTVDSSKPRPLSRAAKPEPAYVARRLRTDKNLVLLMDEAQRILSKVLSNTDIATLVMLNDTDGLPIEVILMLMEHCVQIGKGNMRYIERTGIQWASEGITTISLAEEKIRRHSESTNAFNMVVTVFGLHNVGSPTKKQLEYADAWVNTWKFSEDMLRLAYERCVDTKGQHNMSYINGILRRWHEQGLRSTNDVLSADLSSRDNKKPKQNNSSVSNASYDIDEYENFSIFDD